MERRASVSMLNKAPGCQLLGLFEQQYSECLWLKYTSTESRLPNFGFQEIDKEGKQKVALCSFSQTGIQFVNGAGGQE